MEEALLAGHRTRSGFAKRRPTLLAVAAVATSALAAFAWWSTSTARAAEQPLVEHAPEFVGLWTSAARCHRDLQHEVTFVVSSKDQDKFEEMVHDLSNPDSPRFRQWLTWSQVQTLTRNDKSHHAVKQWLNSLGNEVHGIEDIGSHLIRARAPISLWEASLRAEFESFSHIDARATRPRAKSYTLPAPLHGHVDGVLGILDLDLHPSRTVQRVKPAGEPIGLVSTVDGYVTPALLRSYYGMPSDSSQVQCNGTCTSQAVFSSLHQKYGPSDLTKFEGVFNLPPRRIDELDALKDVASSRNGECKADPGSCMEANLDVQYMTAMSPESSSTGVYYLEQMSSPMGVQPLFKNLIEALHGMRNPPHVISISYGAAEIGHSISVTKAFNRVASQLSAQGVTIIASSGDDGANGLSGLMGRLGWNCELVMSAVGLVVDWPASSPWVTSVGATMGIEKGSPEKACEVKPDNNVLITSGGGFSKMNSVPFWQHGLSAGGGRGVPDVSLAGHSYMVEVGGNMLGVDGTSASAPVFAAMISTINAMLNSKSTPRSSSESVDPVSLQEPAEFSATCDQDTGHHCRLLPCQSFYGPTECVAYDALDYRCHCKPGYCVDRSSPLSAITGGTCEPVSSTCAQETGGTCRIFGCYKSRGPAECKRFGFESDSSGAWTFGAAWKCVCPPGFCAEGGVCKPAQPPDGKKSVGWINPLLYSHASAAFNDITEGTNDCGRKGAPCCKGYEAKVGWDPVTGLGSPKFSELARALGAT
eukprot:TRINITY_DN16021_c0_g1_i3.p1 TRINITY_DN16021_c0_g1~~TRINITY_DN16021_c0_g1_i3.p1  ORF type:complete len:758 (+),score=85.48 TRINITY_DN16021_c0_g1_i3:54-2327(+)